MSDGTHIQRLSNDLSSSPPRVSAQHGLTEGSSPIALSPTATLGHSSPELPSLPDLPPLGRYPVSAPATTDASDSSYFTASWGSPYQNPIPRSIAFNLAPAEDDEPLASSDIDEDSPDARFGLSHLVPSRLPTISRLAPTRPSTPSPSSPPQSPTRFPYLASGAQSIKQFFTSPKRPSVDLDRSRSDIGRRSSNSAWNLRSGWWNTAESNKELELVSSPPIGAVEDERTVDPFQLAGTEDTLARTDRLRAKGHKARDSNLTLTQDDFWPTFNLQEALERNKSKTMNTSRYASVEPPSPPPKDTPKKAEIIVETRAAKPSESNTQDKVTEHEVLQPLPADRITPAPLQRPDSSSSVGRIKKTVKYRGKNVHINIPTCSSGVKPLSEEEVNARMRELEAAGYNTKGYDNWAHDDASNPNVGLQNRDIHPDPADDITARRSRSYKVYVPNKALWDEYMAFLREEKLRMLGVSLGGDSVASSLTISRQGSSLPFSPPIPTSSAGSNRHGQRASVFQFAPPPGGHMSRNSIVSPMGNFGHMHRQSMFSPPTMPMPGMMSPSLQSFSPHMLQTLANSSPGPEMQDRRSPSSPYGNQHNGQGFPFNQRNELLVQMQRQKEQQFAAQMQQQAAVQQTISAPAVRPQSTLQEVPEVEEDDEFGRPQLRSRHGEGPEIVNPKPSHRHNISAKLEQGMSNSDYHLEKSIDKEMDDEEGDALKRSQSAQPAQLPPRTTSLRSTPANGGVLTPSTAAKQSLPTPVEEKDDLENGENVAPSFGKASREEVVNPWANDPTFLNKNRSRPTSISKTAHISHQSSKSSVSGLNVTAKEFNPTSFAASGNPSAAFNPGIFSASAFSFTPGIKKQAPSSAKKAVSPSPQTMLSAKSAATLALSAAAPAFNPTASTFTPGGFGGFGKSAGTAVPDSSEFSFASSPPAFKPTAPEHKPMVLSSSEPSEMASPAGLRQSIFGKIDTSADGKKAKKTKALHPETLEPLEESFVEDADGRLTQSEDRQKRAKTVDSDGENEPLFAPMPATIQNRAKSEELEIVIPERPSSGEDPLALASITPVTLRSDAPTADVGKAIDEEVANVEEPVTTAEVKEVPTKGESELPVEVSTERTGDKLEVEADLEARPASLASSTQDLAANNDLISSTKDTQPGSTSRVFSNSSALSAAATPLDLMPQFVIDEGLKSRMASHLHATSKDNTKEPPLCELGSPRSASSHSKTAHDEEAELSDQIQETHENRERLPSSIRYFDDDVEQQSFQDIDAVMQHLNEQGSDGGIERGEEPSWPDSSSLQFDVSPLPSSPLPHVFQMPQLRSDAPSPSPRRPMITKTLNVDSASVTQDPFSDGRAVPGFDSPVHRLGGSDNPVSDWDDVVSSGQDEEFRQKAEFFGPHVSNVIEVTMTNHFLALEKKFGALMEERLAHTRQPSRRARSRMTVDSDADDEDDVMDTDAYSRGFSPKRDRRLEKMRSMIQETIAAHRPQTPPAQDLTHFETLQKTLTAIHGSVLQKNKVPAPAMPSLEELKAIVEESIAKQNEALIRQREEAVRTADEERFQEFAVWSKEAATNLASEVEARKDAERREAETSRLLSITEEELEQYKELDSDNISKIRALESAAQAARAVETGKDDSQAEVSKKLMDLAMENEGLKETLEEYRLSSDKWRREIDDANAEREKVHHTFGALKIQAEEALRIRDTMRSRIDKLQDDMNHAVGQVAAERTKWQRADAEQRTRYEILAARAEAEARTRERFERELERLETQERESYKLKAALEHEQKENVKLDKECTRLAGSIKELHVTKMELVQTQKENQRLEDLVEALKNECIEHQKTADQFAREFREAREAGRLEVDRTRGLMQIDIETANNEVNIVRADLKAEISRVRAELEATKMESDTLLAKHELDLDQAADAKRDAVQELQAAKDVVFKELRDTFEEHLEGLRKQHRRDLDHTIENKNQSEAFLRDAHSQVLQDLQDHHERTIEQTLNEKEFNEGQLTERLTLADEKIQHLEDKISHLEEKLEMTKSAAAAAAQAARNVKSPVRTHVRADSQAKAAASPPRPRVHEKISPQALRESIAVLQEQLQERESRIEDLEQELSEVDKEAPTKLKNKDTEITWLRELIGVRIDDLSDLVSVLDKDKFNREAVRNAAIRIRASIQMEQNAKESQLTGSTNFPSLATIQNFASPKAAQLAAAIGNWRRGGGGMPPSGLAQSTSTSSSRTQTPSRPAVTTAQSFLNGLMTPPASHVRKTPSPDLSLKGSRLRPLNAHAAGPPRPLGGARALQKRRMSRESEVSAGPSTPPFLKDAEYDDDAEESTTGYYDDGRAQ